MLHSSAIADREKALLSLDLLSQHPAGIGDHSTEDFYANAEEALAKLADADDRLEMLEKYFPAEPNSEVKRNGSLHGVSRS
ncbi:MAG: hypothetical protein AAFU85_20690 [Planctomycetota bacterium]